MPSCRVSKNSILRKRELLKWTKPERIVMRPCNNCSRLNKKCRVNNEFDQCVKCVRLNRKCDLSFFVVKWKRVKSERDRMYQEFLNFHRKVSEVNSAIIEASRLQQETITKTIRLQTQFQFLKNKKQKIIENEFQNIAKLEKNERKFSESTLNDFFFDVFFEQVKILSELDWLNFFVETVAEAFNSSWNFSPILKYSRYVRIFFT